MSATITDALICKSTGQYDKEVMLRLRLEGLGLQRISNLDECFNLLDLSLSHNEIGAIDGLSSLVSLKRLDLSFNKIRKLENLAELISLEYFDIRGNSISSINDIEELRTLPVLEVLHLQNSDGSDGNPACKHPSYVTIITRCLPQLHILDGGHLSITEAFQTLEEHMGKLQPDPADRATPPLDPWYDGLIAPASDEFQVPETEDDVDAVFDSNKRFQGMLSAQTQIADMLSEDCSHLLRKANTALSKANPTYK